MRPINIRRFGFVIAASAMMTLGFGFTACNNDDDSKIEYDYLEAFGPTPVARGGELTFIGQNLSDVVSVTFPDGTTVDVNRVSASKFTITVPDDDNLAPGQLVLNFSNGTTYTTKAKCTFSEPIELKSLSATTVKPGNELTISGRYLAQVTTIGFTGDVKVSLDKVVDKDGNITDEYVSENVVSVNGTSITIKVPAEAVTGKITLTDGTTTVESEEELEISLPVFSKFASDENLLRGESVIEIQGADLDLVTEVTFPNGAVVSAADAEVTETSFKFTLPKNASCGTPLLVTASRVNVETSELKMVNPAVTGWEGNPSEDGKPVKWDCPMSIMGSNLDLVEKVELLTADVTSVVDKFEGSATQIDFVVPSTCKTTEFWSNEAGKNINVGKIYLVLFSGEKIEVTSDDNQLTIGWPWGGMLANEDFTAGDEVTIQYGNKSIASISIDGQNVSFTENKETGSFTFTWPVNVYGEGKTVNITYKNGLTTTVTANPKKPDIPFVLTISEKTDQGGTIIVTGGNLETVTKVMAGKTELTDFTASADGTKMYITVPKDFTACQTSLELIVSGDKKGVSPTITIGNPEVTLWSSSTPVAAGWSDAVSIKDWSKIKAGSVLTFYADANLGTYLQIWFCTPDWNEDTKLEKFKVEAVAANGKYTYTVTAADVAMYGTKGTMVIGNTDGYFKVSKITVLGD